MSPTHIWALSALITFFSGVLGFIAHIISGQVIKRLDEIVQELKQLSRASTVQEQQIKNLQEQDLVIHQLLHDVTTRVHSLETKNP